MEDKLTNNLIDCPALVKLYLLSYGINITNQQLLEIQNFETIQFNKYYYSNSNDLKLINSLHIPSEILLPDDIECSLYINEFSPFTIKVEEDKFFLVLNNDIICDIQFNYPPDFSRLLVNNKPATRFASMYGRYILGLFLNGFCYYIQKKEGCLFCSLGITRTEKGDDLDFVINKQDISDFFNVLSPQDYNRIKYVMYTSGTYKNLDKGIIEQSKIIKACSSSMNNNSVSHHLTTMPPIDNSLLMLLKDAGLHTLAYDIELFNFELFKFYCPAKQIRFGYDKFIKAIPPAIEIFGHSNVKVGFVGGLEPIVSMQEGMNYFANLGASISINVFHPDPGTLLADHPRPTPTYLLKMTAIQRKVYQKFSLEPVFPNGGRRSSLDSEVFRGQLDNFI